MTAYDRHLTARQESRDARIEAEQEQDLNDLADDLWAAELYDPFGSDEAPEPDYFGDDAA